MLGSDEEFEFSDEECTSEEEEDDDDVQEGKERAHSDLTIHIVPLLYAHSYSLLSISFSGVQGSLCKCDGVYHKRITHWKEVNIQELLSKRNCQRTDSSAFPRASGRGLCSCS